MSCLWGKDNHVFVDVDLQTGLGSGGRLDSSRITTYSRTSATARAVYLTIRSRPFRLPSAARGHSVAEIAGQNKSDVWYTSARSSADSTAG